ncbi:hypothetical protein [Frigidibacter oleivorans]|uniref:hypothetical protein n=1 Tax=Frigidibacter oleivorans TaxID=2487129 RepID=UPI0013DFBA11|nr:hypothetical protein [Frigidibacter oleivorans]
MFEIRARRGRWLGLAAAGGTLTAAAAFGLWTGDERRALYLAGLCLFLPGTAIAVLCAVRRLPRLRWSATRIRYTHLFGTREIDLAAVGPVTALTRHHRGGKSHVLTVRVRSTGKTIHMGLPASGLTEADLRDLADRINQGRGVAPNSGS